MLIRSWRVKGERVSCFSCSDHVNSCRDLLLAYNIVIQYILKCHFIPHKMYWFQRLRLTGLFRTFTHLWTLFFGSFTYCKKYNFFSFNKNHQADTSSHVFLQHVCDANQPAVWLEEEGARARAQGSDAWLAAIGRIWSASHQYSYSWIRSDLLVLPFSFLASPLMKHCCVWEQRWVQTGLITSRCMWVCAD